MPLSTLLSAGARCDKKKRAEVFFFRAPMLERCLECSRALVPGMHWLCLSHIQRARRESGAVWVHRDRPRRREGGRDVARAGVRLSRVVYSIDEFIARSHYTLGILGSRTRDLVVLHGAYMRASHRVTRGEMRDLVCSFFEFVHRNAHVSQSLVATCAVASGTPG